MIFVRLRLLRKIWRANGRRKASRYDHCNP